MTAAHAGAAPLAFAADMGIPMSMLPEIRSSSETYGTTRERGAFRGVPIAGILGDQQAATFGQACLSVGEAKNTYGTGNFVLLNTGTEKVMSQNGLITTVCYKLGTKDPIFALEGSIAVTGSLVQWLRDNLKMIDSAPEIEEHARHQGQRLRPHPAVHCGGVGRLPRGSPGRGVRSSGTVSNRPATPGHP